MREGYTRRSDAELIHYAHVEMIELNDCASADAGGMD